MVGKEGTAGGLRQAIYTKWIKSFTINFFLKLDKTCMI